MIKVPIDPKPLGAFVEYTVYPLVQDLIYIVESLDKQGLKLDNSMLIKSVNRLSLILILHTVLSFISQVLVTGIIAWTALKILG